MPLYNPISPLYPSTGTYTGTDAANRSIPHGLGQVPSIVLILETFAGANLGDYKFSIGKGMTKLLMSLGGANSSLTVTTPDATNFYVGSATSYTNSANASGITYMWVAIP